MSDERAKHLAARGVKTGGERVGRISRRSANIRLDLGDLGLEQHYLGPSGYRGDICLSNKTRDAIAILRPPIAAVFNTALHRPLEVSRLLANIDRKAPLSAFVAGCVQWLRRHDASISCLIAYSDPGAAHSETGRAHHGGIYRASNFVHVGEAPAPEPYWLDSAGRRVNRQAMYRELGTKSRAAVARARPDLQYVAGVRKLLFVYPMALPVADVIDRLEAAPRAARTRPFKLGIR